MKPKRRSFLIVGTGPNGQRIYFGLNSRWTVEWSRAKRYAEKYAHDLAKELGQWSGEKFHVVEDVPTQNPRTMGRKPLSTAKAVVIYGRVLRIEAKKTQKHICDAECKKFNHSYYHDFKPGAVMYGLPNGDILIKSVR